MGTGVGRGTGRPGSRGIRMIKKCMISWRVRWIAATRSDPRALYVSVRYVVTVATLNKS